MDIFVTGASGYVGKEVAKTFARAGYRVFGLIRNKQHAQNLQKHEIRPIIGTLTAPPKEAKDAGIIVHCAAGTAEENEKGVRNLLQFNPETFVYTSGVWVYGNQSKPMDETSPLSPLNIVKWRPSVEQMVLQHSGSIVIRPAHVYGYGKGLVGMLFESATKNDFKVPGNGENHWPLVHAADLANLYLLAVEKKASKTVLNGSEKASIKLKDLASAIGKITKAKPNYLSQAQAIETFGAVAEGLMIDQIKVESTNAKNLLKWEPRHNNLLQELEHYLETWRAFRL